MTKSICLCCLLFLCAPLAFAQNANSDRCEVSALDMKTNKGAQLGTFATVVAEEELTTRAFQLPQTNPFIVASVFYTDESMTSEKGADSLSLELALSKDKKRDVLTSLSWAQAEMPLSGFDIGRVLLLVKVSGRNQVVLMECKKGVRR